MLKSKKFHRSSFDLTTVIIISFALCLLPACSDDDPTQVDSTPVYETQTLQVVVDKLVCEGLENTRLEIEWAFTVEGEDPITGKPISNFICQGERGGFDMDDEEKIDKQTIIILTKAEGSRYRINFDMTEIDHVIDPDNPDDPMPAITDWIKHPFTNSGSQTTLCQSGTQKVRVHWHVNLMD